MQLMTCHVSSRVSDYGMSNILSYLDIMITIDSGKYSTAVYDKRDSFNFKIVNFPQLCSNILNQHMVYIFPS